LLEEYGRLLDDEGDEYCCNVHDPLTGRGEMKDLADDGVVDDNETDVGTNEHVRATAQAAANIRRYCAYSDDTILHDI